MSCYYCGRSVTEASSELRRIVDSYHGGTMVIRVCKDAKRCSAQASPAPASEKRLGEK